MKNIIKSILFLLISLSQLNAVDKYPECKHHIMINGLKDPSTINKNDPETYLSVRSGSGANYKIIEKLINGDYVKGCKVKGNWVKIIYACSESGGLMEDESIPCRYGWVYKKYLSPIDDWNMEE